VDDFRKKEIESQLARLKQAEQKQMRAVEVNRNILARAARTTVGDLQIGDLAEAIHDAVQSQKREILEHVHRLFRHVKSSAEHDNERSRAFDRKLHRRLFELESDVRQLRRKGAP
jgi:hypothetical protein